MTVQELDAPPAPGSFMAELQAAEDRAELKDARYKMGKASFLAGAALGGAITFLNRYAREPEKGRNYLAAGACMVYGVIKGFDVVDAREQLNQAKLAQERHRLA